MREQSLFIEALEREDPAERAVFLNRACAGDPDLRQRIERLLQRHQEAGSLLEAPALPLAATLDEPRPLEGPGTAIGPYKLLEQIGEGGFGVVYMAEQQEPVRRRVALKVLKPGMDSKQVVARFEAERQALALMDHPNIARILDGGATASGRPYFVMELVKGARVTDFCDQNNLSVGERLGLFVDVCRAVQHAHQKGIIHRDLKPSNVLVTVHDTTPVVKVIDFGVAKALGQELTDKTLFTGFAQMVGTPLYMSPEQAGQSSLDVDTRSDIYSLGVLLYELLTGTTPFDKGRLKELGYDELRRVIREEEPPKPSTRISTLGQAATTISTKRQSDPRRLRRLCRGDLDWVVMKALEKDRNRRYESTSAFAADVQRYLADEPVLARQPSVVHRFRKLTRRHKTATRAATVVAALLLFVVGAYGLHLWRVAHLTSGSLVTARAALAERDFHLAGVKLAEARGRISNDALVLRCLAEEVEQLQKAVRMVQALEEARLEKGAVKDGRFDETAAETKYTELFRDYGAPVDELQPREAGQRLRALACGARSIELELAAALDDWAWVRRLQAKVDDPVSGHRLRVAGEIDPDPWRERLRRLAAAEKLDAKSLGQLVTTAETEKLPAATLARLSAFLKYAGAREEAVALLRRAQQEHPSDFWINHDLAFLLWESGRSQEAIGYYRAALAIRPQSPGARLNLGRALGDLGRADEAIAHLREAIRLKPDYAGAYVNLGAALESQGKRDEAIAEYRRAIEFDPRLAVAHYNLAKALSEQRKLDEATAEYRKAIELGPKDPRPHNNLGNLLRAQGKLDDAVGEFRKAIDINPNHVSAHSNLGSALYAQGKLDEAVVEFRKAVELDPKRAEFRSNLGGMLYNRLHTQGKLGRGEGLAEAVAELRTAIQLDPKSAHAHFNLANCLLSQRKLDAAVAEYRKAISLKQDYIEAYCHLAAALVEQGRYQEAETALGGALRLNPALAQIPNSFAWRLANAQGPKRRGGRQAVAFAELAVKAAPNNGKFWNTLGAAHYRAGNWKEAVTALEKSMQLRQGGDGFDWFFLAMAHWQLGDRDKARQWFDRAVQWLDKYQPRNEELGRFRAEAAALLGGKEKP